MVCPMPRWIVNKIRMFLSTLCPQLGHVLITAGCYSASLILGAVQARNFAAGAGAKPGYIDAHLPGNLYPKIA